jgi:hypothetical protein
MRFLEGEDEVEEHEKREGTTTQRPWSPSRGSTIDLQLLVYRRAGRELRGDNG